MVLLLGAAPKSVAGVSSSDGQQRVSMYSYNRKNEPPLTRCCSPQLDTVESVVRIRVTIPIRRTLLCKKTEFAE